MSKKLGLREQWNMITTARDKASIFQLEKKIDFCNYMSLVEFFMFAGFFTLTIIQYMFIGYIGFTVIGAVFSMTCFSLSLMELNDRNQLRLFLYLKKLNGE